MASIVRKVGKKWIPSDHVPYDGDDTSSAEAERRGAASPIWSSSANAVSYVEQQLKVDHTRRENYQLYDLMDDTYAPASAVLDAYADNSTQLDMTSEANSQDESHVVQFVSEDERLLERLAEMRTRLTLDERAWALARDLTKNGEVFEEVVVTQDLTIDRLKQLPTDYMVRNQDKYGILPQKKAFFQLNKERDNIAAVFDDWEVIHFRLQRKNEDAYGTSILKSVRKVYKQLRMIEDAMVIARLTRANSRLVYMIDTGGLTPPQAAEHLERMKQQLKRKNLLNGGGFLKANVNPMSAEEDIFMATAQGSDARVEQLYGDLNIGNLTDVEYFQNQFFGGVKVPKSYVGLERDLNSKQTLSMQDIQFARTIRRIQMSMRIGYKQLCDLFLILEGGASSSTSRPQYSIALPGLQTIDELRQWEMKRIQAEVARYYVQELYLDPVTVYIDLLGFSEEQAKELFVGTPTEFVQAQRNKNAVKSFNNTADKKLGQAIGETVGFDTLQALRDLNEMVLERLALLEAKDKGKTV